MNAEDLCFTPATELARLIRSRELSPVEITEAILARMERLNPVLNCYCTPTPERARADARRAEAAVMRGEALGPLHGIPYSIKDLVPTRGIRTMRGSKIYEHFVPEEDAPIVTRMQAAGGVFLGKTTTPEFGWKGMTDSPVTGVTRNPWNPELTPGGSSGGGSAQVAAGLGPLAQGSDGGGSIRIPAGFSGIFGLKPTFGRIPNYPPNPYDAMSHLGPMTRTVADSALMLKAVAGPHPADRLDLPDTGEDYPDRLNEGVRGLRVAWSPDLGYARVQPEVAEVCGRAANAFSEVGCHVEEVADPGFGDPTDFFAIFWQAGSAGALADYLPKWEKEIDPGLLAVARKGFELPALELVRAQVARHHYYTRVRRFFERYDLLLTPTLAVLPFAAGVPYPDALPDGSYDWMSWTPFSYPFNLTHMPAATVPAGWSAEGLPVGLQIVAPRFADLRVLQAAAAFEQARPWADRRPPL